MKHIINNRQSEDRVDDDDDTDRVDESAAVDDDDDTNRIDESAAIDDDDDDTNRVDENAARAKIAETKTNIVGDLKGLLIKSASMSS